MRLFTSAKPSAGANKAVFGTRIIKNSNLLKHISMAKQIQSFGMSAMTIGACSNFHTTAVKYINEATPAVLHIEDKSPAYSESSDTLASIVNRKRAFITTPQMRSADKTRDAALGAISSVVNALVTSPVDERRSAAELLSQQLSPYRGIRAHEYNKETAEIRGMLAMLEEADNAVAITTLGLSPEVDALREANAAFEEAFDARNDEVSAMVSQKSISSADAVAEANRLYQEIAQTVNAYDIVQPTEELNAFIDKMNGLVGSLSAVSGSSASGSEGPDVPAPEPTENEG